MTSKEKYVGPELHPLGHLKLTLTTCFNKAELSGEPNLGFLFASCLVFCPTGILLCISVRQLFFASKIM